MANFDLARLYGGRDFIDFPAGEEAIRAWFHHAQPEEIAIALHCAGLVQKEETIVSASSDSGFATAAALVQAAVELACLCLEDFENLDAWKVEGSFETGKHGLKQLNKAARASIPRVVLRDIGERLFEKSNLTSEEKAFRSVAFFGLLKKLKGEKSGLPDCTLCATDPDLKEEWGCLKESKTFAYDLGGLIVRRCPNALAKHPLVEPGWTLYAAFKRGCLPRAGGMRKQTAFFHDLVKTLEAYEVQAESWFLEKTKKKGA